MGGEGMSEVVEPDARQPRCWRSRSAVLAGRMIFRVPT